MIFRMVLALLGFLQEFSVETDASTIGFRLVLKQGGHPLAYMSEALLPKNKTQ